MAQDGSVRTAMVGSEMKTIRSDDRLVWHGNGQIWASAAEEWRMTATKSRSGRRWRVAEDGSGQRWMQAVAKGQL